MASVHGDSMVAGFLAGYLQTGSYEKAFQMGVCTGSASAFSEELATKEEVMSIRNLGRKTYEEFLEILHKEGIYLADEKAANLFS